MDDKLAIKFNDQGLVCAVVVDDATEEVLMVAWMNDAAVRETLATKKATFFSRSRGKMWIKGEESGHVQHVKSVRVDCDQDTLEVRVTQEGGACHEGYRSCFFREITPDGGLKVVAQRLFDPKAVYKK
jgi:phosphoribosyl-AMP cyclohydrolase